MINSDKITKVPYGGDYNPEQWPEEIWQEDMRIFKLAGIDIVTLNVFSWASLQKDETTYDFSKLDKIMELVRENGLKVCLATSTGAHPAWMAKKYPDILRTEFNGMKRKFGGRHNSCPNSPTYQKYSVLLAQKLAERYRGYNNIVAWHVSNEFFGTCYCENCEKAFRVWLKDKYQTIDNLNAAWDTAFWGHTFYEWDEIVLPNMLSEFFAENRVMFQGIALDYSRFNSDSLLNCYKAEYEVLKRITPNIPVTTNFMDFYKPLDYQKWANYMDFISWDNYPSVDAPYTRASMSHDLFRGLKNGMPFSLMEQTPSVSNWHTYCALKRPGVMRLWSYQAVAHGADTVMFFQMRRSVGACEKYHGAVIDHCGHENTRVFREIAEMGEELSRLGDKTLGSVAESRAAIIFDWDNWWALEYSAGPSCELKYMDEVFNYYNALNRMNISVDLVGVDADLSAYKLVIAPVLYMTKPGIDERLKAFVQGGGAFVATYFSGIVDEHDLVITGGYPGKLRELLGVWVEEIDALPSGTENRMQLGDREYPAKLLCDILHTEGAQVLARYTTDFYQGSPAITKNSVGSGEAYYVATRSSEDFYSSFLADLCAGKGIAPVLTAPADIEVTRRVKGAKAYTFILNHAAEERTVTLDASYEDLLHNITYTNGQTISVQPKDVLILESSR